MNRHLLTGALAALLAVPPCSAGAADRVTGDYTSPVLGPAALSGDVRVTVSGRGSAALLARGAAAPITGTVTRLVVHSEGMPGLVATQGTIRLGGPVEVTTTGSGASGIQAQGPGASVTLNGPVSVATSGAYAHAALVNDTGDSGVGLNLYGPATLRTSGTSAYGLYVFGGTVHLGATDIRTTGANADGFHSLGGTTIFDGPLRVRVADPRAYAMLIQGRAPYTDNVVTTRVQAGVANPQRLDVEGPVRVYGAGNRLELDLADGSHLHSTLLEADNAGVVSLNFYGPHAQWTTGMGSVIGNGTLNLDFTGGGAWNLPATDAGDTRSATPAPALFIQSAGHFNLRGTDTLRVLPATSLAAGQSGTYALIQAEGALPGDLTAMRLESGNLLYRADRLAEIAIDGRPTLEVALTRLRTDEALPDLEPGVGDLVPDGPGRADDGGGNPFLALALAQHLNGLSLAEITSALEGAPALTRALPVASLARHLEARIRQNSPTGALYGRGPAQKFVSASPGSDLSAKDGACGGFQAWVAPLYLHERESLPRPGKPSSRHRADLGGLLLGLGRVYGPWTLGGGLSFGGGDSVTTNAALPRTTGRIAYAGGMLYGLWERDAWSLGLELNVLRTWNELRQQNPVMPLKAPVRVDGLGLEAVAARRFEWGAWSVTPNAGLEYSHFTQHAYTVSGTLGNGRDVDLFCNETVRQGLWRAPVGIQVGRLLPPDGPRSWLAQPELHVRYIPVLGPTRADQPVRRADAPDIRATLTGAGLDRHTLEAGLGVDVRRGTLRLAVGYDWQHSTHRNAHMVSGSLGWTF